MKKIALITALTLSILAGQAYAQWVPIPPMPPRPIMCTTTCTFNICTTFCS
jgi:hypothetical protein